MDFFIKLFKETFYLYNEMAIYLLFGFFLGGVIYAFLPQNKIKQAIGKKGLFSSLKSSLLGVPLPICSCGVVPTALSIKERGASRGAVISFLISTPQTGVDSIAATYSLMGPIFAIFRPLVAFLTGVIGGTVTDLANNDSVAEGIENKVNDEKLNFVEKCKKAYKYGFHQLLADIAKWIVIGLFLGGLITVLIPDNFFTQYISSPVISYIAVLAISIPLYVCATGSIPIATALLLKGLSPGAAFVFLMAGPATNATSLIVLFNTLGKKDTIIYLITIVVGSILGGIFFDILLFDSFVNAFKEMHHVYNGLFAILKQLSSLILAYYLLKALFFKEKEKEVMKNEKSIVFEVSGMTCNHCKMNVLNTATEIEGVLKADVNLDSGELILEGNFDKKTLISAIENKGYKVVNSKQ